ncbi:hypothetical protein GCM10028799_34690 [Kribbella italica]
MCTGQGLMAAAVARRGAERGRARQTVAPVREPGGFVGGWSVRPAHWRQRVRLRADLRVGRSWVSAAGGVVRVTIERVRR